MLASFHTGTAGQPRLLRVLFIGNSYTYSNDLPAIMQGLAASGGDSLDYVMEAPDGASLEEHYRRGSAAIGLRDGAWDYIVLQEQSLRPALPIRQVEREFFRYGELLDKQAKALHPGAETVLYVTWGRWSHTGPLCGLMPAACDYWGLDSLITHTRRAHRCQDGPGWPGLALYAGTPP